VLLGGDFTTENCPMHDAKILYSVFKCKIANDAPYGENMCQAHLSSAVHHEFNVKE
jgi:hypothetical protein